MQDMAQVNRLTVAGPVYVISDCLPNVFATGGETAAFQTQLPPFEGSGS